MGFEPTTPTLANEKLRRLYWRLDFTRMRRNARNYAISAEAQ